MMTECKLHPHRGIVSHKYYVYLYHVLHLPTNIRIWLIGRESCVRHRWVMRETSVEGNNGGGWSSDGMVLWLRRRQNGDTVEWCGEWPWLRWCFYNSGGIVRRFGEDSLRRWCRFNASVLAREGRQRDDEAEATSSSWLNGKKPWHGVVVWHCRLEERRHRRGKREETTSVGLTQILLDWKMKKIYVVDSTGTNGWWRFKAVIS
jgi:hypothetical protein